MAENLAREFAKENEVEVLTSWYKTENKFETKDGYRIHRIKVFRKELGSCSIFEMSLFFLLAIVPTIKLVKKFKPDIVCCHFSVPVGPLGFIIYKIFKIPYIIHTHGGDIPGFIPEQTNFIFPYIKWLTIPIWNNARIVIANSKGAEDLAKKAYPKARLTFIRNGVDLNSFLIMKQSFHKDEHDDFRLISIGRIAIQKGFNYLVEALAILKNQRINFFCQIVGDGPLRKQLEEQIRAAGLEKSVEITGWLSHEETIERLLKSDAYVSSSVNEGMSVAMLEAMACGLPVIGTNVMGNNEIIENNITGFMAPPKNPALLAEFLRKLIEDERLRQQFSENTKEIIKKYSWEEIAREHMVLYNKITSRC